MEKKEQEKSAVNAVSFVGITAEKSYKISNTIEGAIVNKGKVVCKGVLVCKKAVAIVTKY